MGRTAQEYWLIALGFFFALLVAIYPFSQPLAWLRPALVCLLVIFWVLWTPRPLGVGAAWLIGLLQDVLEGNVWGAHAVGLAVVAYICLVSYRRLRSYSLSQQTFWVMVFVGVHQLVVNWIQGVGGASVPASHVLGSTLVSALCWPFLVLCMNWLRRRLL